MSEIAKCPVCGEAPVVLDYYGDGYEKSYTCCNVEVHGRELWNQYAAAMGLVRAMVAMWTPNESGHKSEEWYVLSESAKKAYEAFK